MVGWPAAANLISMVLYELNVTPSDSLDCAVGSRLARNAASIAVQRTLGHFIVKVESSSLGISRLGPPVSYICGRSRVNPHDKPKNGVMH